MKKLVIGFVVVLALGLGAFALATELPAPEVEPLEVQLQDFEPAPLLSLKLEVVPQSDSSCSPSCSTVHGSACNEGDTVICYLVCHEPAQCVCGIGGTYRCI